MSQVFSCIGLIGKPSHLGANNTLISLYHFLTDKNYRVVVDDRVAGQIDIDAMESADLVNLGQACDLAIVVGGDGYMLGAARTLSRLTLR
jgi:NAD+ kinase